MLYILFTSGIDFRPVGDFVRDLDGGYSHCPRGPRRSAPGSWYARYSWNAYLTTSDKIHYVNWKYILELLINTTFYRITLWCRSGL